MYGEIAYTRDKASAVPTSLVYKQVIVFKTQTSNEDNLRWRQRVTIRTLIRVFTVTK